MDDNDSDLKDDVTFKNNIRTTDVTQTSTSKAPIYVCPKHGEIGTHAIYSYITGHEGDWCMKCILEKLDELGVCRVEKK